MSEVVVLAAAEAQLFQLFDKFDDWREGAGIAFDADFREACEALERFPELGRRVENQMHRLLLRRWNLGLFCIIEGKRVLVHGVVDVRLSPDNFRRQLGLI